ncbi:MAG: helix-turn-helix domain-containing protein [Gemmatimonadetes bacterium]|nr:helix-turn-helix domain-containing protein [Gemmatimonadota bacterium]
MGSVAIAFTSASVRFASVSDELPISSNEWLTIPEVAQRLDVRITRVHRMISEVELLAQRRNGVLYVPGELIPTEQRVADHIAGLLVVLRDDGYSPDEMLRWLFTPDESLGGKPVDALYGHKAREVKRRAQALAL